MRPRHGTLALVASSALGCGHATGDPLDSWGQDGAQTSSSTAAAASGDSDPSTTATGAAEASSDEPTTKFDLNATPSADVPVDNECRKVDFMFVIDDSGSMLDDQINLIANFPTFIAGIQGTLDQVDEYQIGVIASDAYVPNYDYGCRKLGALTISTEGGWDSSDAQCGPYANGKNFMTEADDLANKFACAAQLGTAGDDTEKPMEAMVNAVERIWGGPGGCNDGYLRDDALLVVVIITDECDGPECPSASSVGDPQSWYDAVVAAKGGIAENAVVLSLVNNVEEQCPPIGIKQDSSSIREFTQMFGANGFVGPLCAPDWGPYFDQATEIITQACENFVPAG